MDYQKALKILDLPDPPAPTQIKKAYRAMALKFHPDRNPDQPAVLVHFQECTAAYNYLLEHIDRWSTQTGQSPAEKKALVTDLEDIFDDIFGFSREDRILGFQPAQDLELTLVQLAYGADVEARLAAFEKCPRCQGVGAADGCRATICTHCFGAGRVNSSGKNEDYRACVKCGGRGRNIKENCFRCDGYGRLRHLSRQKVTVPAGLKPNYVYTLHSQDIKTHAVLELFIRPILSTQNFLTVQDGDIIMPVYLNHSLQKSGGSFEIPTLWGLAEIEIPPETQEGSVLGMSGFGFWKDVVQGIKGDCHLRIRWVGSWAAKKWKKKMIAELSEENRAYGERKIPWWKRIF